MIGGQRYHRVSGDDSSDEDNTEATLESAIRMERIERKRQHYATTAWTLENVRYSLGETPHTEHVNEDKWFETHDIDAAYYVLALFDGHDGHRTVDHVCNSFDRELQRARSVTSTLLLDMFLDSESNFFQTIRPYLDERQRVQDAIPTGMKSYQASQEYPDEVARLAELDLLISGGCTAVVAVICDRKLYVANVGDSRAIIVKQTNGALEAVQLSVDHDVKNEEELKRLEKLGLDPKELKRVGRLGPQENTRSIGDYNIKDGYKSVDILSHASGPPGTAEPSVITVDIEDSFLYLMLMSDGVYKSIEAAVDEAQTTTGANQYLAEMVHTCAQTPRVEFNSVAKAVLDQVAHLHEEAYQKSAQQDVRSPKATSCRKRDDMTLIVSKFNF